MLFTLTMVFIVSVSGLTAAKTPSSCKGPSFAEMELNYSLPIRPPCGQVRLSNGSTITTIPKLIPVRIMNRCQRDGIPGGHRICRRPDCLSGPCQRGWCEETMVGYQCHCPEGFSGKDCSEADQITAGYPLHGSNATDDSGSNTTTSSFLSEQSSTMWTSLYSSFTSWMTTEATTMSIEASTMSTEATAMPTEATAMSTEATTMQTEATTMQTEATTMQTEATTMPTEATMMQTEPTMMSTEATTLVAEMASTTSGIPGDSNEIVCEEGNGNTYKKDITCSPSTVIDIVSANYGRTEDGDIACPHGSIKTTDCKYDQSLTVVRGWCQNNTECTLEANKAAFNNHDPCVETYKYINVTYRCVSP